MEISKVIVSFFSPTMSTYRCVKEIALAFNTTSQELDLCKEINEEREFKSDELLIIGVPVYAGRVPEIATKRIEKIRGNNTPTIIVATYGNRHYDDAILELSDVLTKQAFKVVAATTIITQHSIVADIAKGRPDINDLAFIGDFSKKVKQRIADIKDINSIASPQLPGNSPYKPYKTIPFVPHSTSSCNQCMKCAKSCPVNAISEAKPEYTDKNACIRCMRCIMVCPSKARKLFWHERFLAKRAIIKKCLVRREPEYWGIV